MTLIVPTSGEKVLLQSMLGQAPLASVNYHLYSNNWTPQRTDTISAYTELILPGYALITVNPGSWTFSADSFGGSQATAPAISWTCVGPGPCYGYYVTDPSNGIVLWAELLPGGPYNFLAGGSTLQVTPFIAGD